MALDKFRKINITLNKANQRVLETQIAKSGDVNGRELVVQVTNNGIIEDQTGTTLKLNWQHENGNQGSTNFKVVDIKMGKFSVYYPKEMLYKGKVNASIEISSNGQITNSMNFKIIVQADVFNGEAGTVNGVFISLAEVNKKLDDREAEYVELKNRQTSVENQFNSVQQELTDKDVISAPEIIAARNGEANLKTRIDKDHQEVNAQLAQNVAIMNSQHINILYPPKPLQPAKGDGVNDDTVAIQAIIDYAKNARMTVLFPPATYIIRQVYLHPGLTLLGYGATIKRPDNTGNWIRTFSIPESGDYMWGGDRDSELLTIKGFTFDGNSANQGAYSKHELQHAHLIFLSADNTKSGKLRSHIEDCVFRNCVADGISIHRNQDSKISNCVAENCFRGGIVLTGGYTDLQITNFKTKGDVDRTGIDFEVDGKGYGGTYKTNITINGMILDNGDFDVNIRDDSILTATNIQSYKSPFLITSRGSRIKISNSLFYMENVSMDNTIVSPRNVTFSNCEFVIYRTPNSQNKEYACIHVLFNTNDTSITNQSLTLVDCDFMVDSSILETDTTYGILIEGDNKEGNTVNVLGGSISKEFDFGIATKQGLSYLFVKDIKIDAKTAFRLWFSATFPLQTVIDSVQILKNVETYMNFPDANNKSLTFHKNVVISNEQNVITSTYPLSLNKFFGGRIIYGDGSPITTPTGGFVGDVFRLKNPIASSPYEWVCITSDKTKATWKESKTLGA